MINKFIDSHAHLTMSPLFEKIDQALIRAEKANVYKIINICINEDLLNKSEKIIKEKRGVFLAAATPPHDLEKEDDFFPLVKDIAQKGKLVAIGETGLDYYYTQETKENQKKQFIKYSSLAKDTNLPLIIHCRDAFPDLFEIASSHDIKKAVLHCFTGDIKQAKEVIRRGWYISFSGIITFKNAAILRQVIEEIPLEKMLIETDSPYLAPQKYRGQTNEPAYVTEVAKQISQIKQVDLDVVAKQTTKNAESFFNI
jgi:TatD DNase family protein